MCWAGLWAVVVTDFLQASILMPFCLVLVITSLARVGGVGGLIHSLPPEMKTLHVSGEFGWIYIVSWTIMVSFGYNTSAMAQRYFSVDDEHSARKVALLCCGLFFAGAFLWFIPPMAMRVMYPGPACGVAVARQSQRRRIRGRELDLAAAWIDRRHAGCDVQRHHGQSFGAIQS